MSQSDDACPRCCGRRIVFGELSRGIMVGPSEGFTFRAFASRLSWLRNGAKLSPNMAACATCGLVWGQVSVDNLLAHLERLPTPEVRHWLKSAHDTPL